MSDLISREAALDIVQYYHGFCEAYAEIKKLESTKSAKNKGKWIKYGPVRCNEQHYQCTNCDYYINFGIWGEVYTKQFKYCPNCGAKMEEAKE